MSQIHPKPMPDTTSEKTVPVPATWKLLVPVILIAICSELGISILNNSVLTVYLKLGLKISTKIFPFILMPFYVSEALFKFPLGVLADKFGRKPLMLAGALITVFTPLVMISIHYDANAATATAVLIAFGFLRLLDGIGQSSLWPALYAYVGDTVQEARRGAAMGLLNVTNMIGLAFGFLAGGFVDDTFGPVLTGDATLHDQMKIVGQRFQTHFHHHAPTTNQHVGEHHVSLAQHLHNLTTQPLPTPVVLVDYQPAHYFPSFYLASVLFALAAIVAAVGVKSTKRKRYKHRAADSVAIPETQKITWAGFMTAMRSVPQYLALAFFTFCGIGCIALLVKLFVMEEFHLTEKQIGLLILWPALTIGALAVPIGHLADKWGKSRAIRLGFVLAAAGLWGIVVLHHQHIGHEWGFVLAAAVMGLGFVMAFPAWLAQLTIISGDTQRGTVLGAVSTAQGIGTLTGTAIGGLLYSHSHIAPFVASASLVTLGAGLALLFVREPSAKVQAP